MKTFAVINSSGLVENLCVVSDLETESLNQVQSHTDGTRKQPAVIGGTYHRNADVFVDPQPFSSWTLDDNFDWVPPVARPDGSYRCDEASQNWVTI